MNLHVTFNMNKKFLFIATKYDDKVQMIQFPFN